jgi:hypothetical protein
MKEALFILALLFSYPYSLRAAETPSPLYTIDDLKVLANNSEWYEYLQHVKDIRPSERNKEWQELTTKVALSLVKDIKNFGPYTKKELDVLNNLKSFDFLANDEFFTQYLSDFKLQFLKGCLRNDENSMNCLLSADNFWDTNHQSAQTGLDFFVLFYQHFSTQPEKITDNKMLLKTYWKFLIPTIQEKQNNTCQQENIKNTMRSIHYTTLSTPSWDIKLDTINNLVSENCWTHLKTIYQDDLKSSPIAIAEMSFKALASAKKLDSQYRNLYYLRFFLEKSTTGEDLNLAWNTLIQLSNNKSERDELLKLVKSLDPIPDQLFSLEDQQKRNVLVKHLGSHFPEFIDFYTKTCLGYLDGSQQYPRGNPTIHCNKLLEEQEFQSLLVPGTKLKYDRLRINI